MNENTYMTEHAQKIRDKYSAFKNTIALQNQNNIDLELATHFEVAALFIYKQEKIPQTTFNYLMQIADTADKYMQSSSIDETREKREVEIIKKIANRWDDWTIEKVISQFKDILQNPINDKLERRYVSDLVFDFGKNFKGYNLEE